MSESDSGQKSNTIKNQCSSTDTNVKIGNYRLPILTLVSVE